MATAQHRWGLVAYEGYSHVDIVHSQASTGEGKAFVVDEKGLQSVWEAAGAGRNGAESAMARLQAAG